MEGGLCHTPGDEGGFRTGGFTPPVFAYHGAAGDAWEAVDPTKTPLAITPFGEDSRELYVTDLAGDLDRAVGCPKGVTA